MIEDLIIRPAKLEDLPILYRFEQGIISAERPFDPTLKPDPINYYDLKELIETDRAEVIVACTEKTIIGSGYAKIKAASDYLQFDHYAYLGFMFVLPEYRGNGVIQAIMDALSQWARGAGMNEIRLEVYDENDSALRAYQKFGLKRHMVEMRMKLD